MRRWGAVLLASGVLASACVDDTPPTSVELTLEVFGPYQGVEADRFGAVLTAFEISSGVPVRYVGSSDFVADLLDRGADPRRAPDVAVVPQIGVVEQLVADELIVPLGAEVRSLLAENYGEQLAALGEVDETSYAVPYRLTVKSLVWYRPAVFDERGWSIPTTLDELDQLVRTIRADGELAPWCFGIRAGGATGWAATDWSEDMVLRVAGPDTYQRWARGDVGFGAAAIERSFDRFSELVIEDEHSFGGLDGMLETQVTDAVLPLFDEAGCAMHKQADFVVGWMPDRTDVGHDGDVDFFVLPGEEAGVPQPILIGGDSVVQFRESPALERLMSYLASPAAAEVWARHGGFLSPNSAVDDDVYPEEYLVEIAAALGDASVLAYDASDQMPPAFGSGELWELMTDWVGGAIDDDELAARADAGLARALGDEELVD